MLRQATPLATLIALVVLVGIGHARVPDRADAAGAGLRHRDAVRDGGRRDLRHHAGRHRPLDPVGRLAGQRDRRADACRASAISASCCATLVGALAGVLSGVAHVKLKIPSFIATLAVGGIAAGAALIISDAQAITMARCRARLSRLDHRAQPRPAARGDHRRGGPRGRPVPPALHRLRPLQPGDRRGRARGLRLGRRGSTATRSSPACCRARSPASPA